MAFTDDRSLVSLPPEALVIINSYCDVHEILRLVLLTGDVTLRLKCTAAGGLGMLFATSEKSWLALFRLNRAHAPVFQNLTRLVVTDAYASFDNTKIQPYNYNWTCWLPKTLRDIKIKSSSAFLPFTRSVRPDDSNLIRHTRSHNGRTCENLSELFPNLHSLHIESSSNTPDLDAWFFYQPLILSAFFSNLPKSLTYLYLPQWILAPKYMHLLPVVPANLTCVLRGQEIVNYNFLGFLQPKLHPESSSNDPSSQEIPPLEVFRDVTALNLEDVLPSVQLEPVVALLHNITGLKSFHATFSNSDPSDVSELPLIANLPTSLTSLNLSRLSQQTNMDGIISKLHALTTLNLRFEPKLCGKKMNFNLLPPSLTSLRCSLNPGYGDVYGNIKFNQIPSTLTKLSLFGAFAGLDLRHCLNLRSAHVPSFLSICNDDLSVSYLPTTPSFTELKMTSIQVMAALDHLRRLIPASVTCLEANVTVWNTVEDVATFRTLEKWSNKELQNRIREKCVPQVKDCNFRLEGINLTEALSSLKHTLRSLKEYCDCYLPWPSVDGHAWIEARRNGNVHSWGPDLGFQVSDLPPTLEKLITSSPTLISSLPGGHLPPALTELGLHLEGFLASGGDRQLEVNSTAFSFTMPENLRTFAMCVASCSDGLVESAINSLLKTTKPLEKLYAAIDFKHVFALCKVPCRLFELNIFFPYELAFAGAFGKKSEQSAVAPVPAESLPRNLSSFSVSFRDQPLNLQQYFVNQAINATHLKSLIIIALDSALVPALASLPATLTELELAFTNDAGATALKLTADWLPALEYLYLSNCSLYAHNFFPRLAKLRDFGAQSIIVDSAFAHLVNTTPAYLLSLNRHEVQHFLIERLPHHLQHSKKVKFILLTSDLLSSIVGALSPLPATLLALHVSVTDLPTLLSLQLPSTLSSLAIYSPANPDLRSNHPPIPREQLHSLIKRLPASIQRLEIQHMIDWGDVEGDGTDAFNRLPKSLLALDMACRCAGPSFISELSHLPQSLVMLGISLGFVHMLDVINQERTKEGSLFRTIPSLLPALQCVYAHTEIDHNLHGGDPTHRFGFVWPNVK